MSDWLDRMDRLLRRNRALPRMQWLRDKLRKPYHAILRRNQKGFALNIGGVMPVRLPGEFCARELVEYEAVSARAIRDWSDANPGGLFIDIGCSYGYFSCGVLFSDPAANVIAIDADLPSLSITKYVCSHAPRVEERLALIHALIAPETSGAWSLVSLASETARLLSKPALRPDPKKTNYVNLDTRIPEKDLPRVSLDDLISQHLDATRSACMIKCDVEGAELLVLQGAETVLARYRPTLLLSVHPPYLPRFEGSVNEISSLLDRVGYRTRVIDIDHEEHWLCLPG